MRSLIRVICRRVTLRNTAYRRIGRVARYIGVLFQAPPVIHTVVRLRPASNARPCNESRVIAVRACRLAGCSNFETRIYITCPHGTFACRWLENSCAMTTIPAVRAEISPGPTTIDPLIDSSWRFACAIDRVRNVRGLLKEGFVAYFDKYCLRESTFPFLMFLLEVYRRFATFLLVYKRGDAVTIRRRSLIATLPRAYSRSR